jgi:hypothetical protein
MSWVVGLAVASKTPSLKTIPKQVVPLLTASLAYSIQAEQRRLLCYLEQAAVWTENSDGPVIPHLSDFKNQYSGSNSGIAYHHFFHPIFHLT